MTKSGPTRSFGPPQPGTILTEELPEVNVYHQMFFADYISALREGRGFLVKPQEVRRVLQLMDAIRLSSQTGSTVQFEN